VRFSGQSAHEAFGVGVVAEQSAILDQDSIDGADCFSFFGQCVNRFIGRALVWDGDVATEPAALTHGCEERR